MNFLKYLQKIFQHYPNPVLYLKGGAVLGIKVLQDTNHLITIKDFDFVLEDDRCCNDYFYYEFGKEFGISLNGCQKRSQGKKTKLHVMRHYYKKGYELLVCNKDDFELPMTSMKIYITEKNCVSFFNLLNKLKNETYQNINFKELLKFKVTIPNHIEGGMFNQLFEPNNTVISNIIINTTENKHYQQCLYYLISNPTNITRLKFKNIPKSEYIKQLYQSRSTYPNWLLDENLILNLVEKLIVNITLYFDNIYDCYKKEIITLTEHIIVFDKLVKECDSLDIKINRDLIRSDLTDIYIEMFLKMDGLFENVNINRWINSFDLSDPLLDIFKFSYELKLKLNDTNIITNGKILSKSPTWLIINKIQKLSD